MQRRWKSILLVKHRMEKVFEHCVGDLPPKLHSKICVVFFLLNFLHYISVEKVPVTSVRAAAERRRQHDNTVNGKLQASSR